MKRLAGVGLVLIIIWIGLIGCDLIQPPIVEPPNARWLDTFQDYPLWEFPTENWIKSGNAGAPGNEVFMSVSPVNNVLQLKGVYGGNWAAGAYRAVDLTSSHRIFFRVRTTDLGDSGSHRFNAVVDFSPEPDWRAANRRRLIFFGVEGNIRTSYDESPAPGEGLILGAYEPFEWYDVEITYRRTQNSTVVLSYTINGDYAGVIETAALPSEPDFAYIGIWSGGNTTVWFDDVGVMPW